MQRGLLLYVVVGHGFGVLQLFARINKPLLVHRHALFVGNLLLHLAHSVAGLRFHGDGFSGQRFDKNLHFVALLMTAALASNGFKHQLARLVHERAQRGYERDVRRLADELKARGVPAGQLGDALENMGRQSQLLADVVRDDDEFRVVQRRDLSQNTIDYLNRLQHDKLFRCRLCYSHADWLWCEFHKTHAYRGPRDMNVDAYVDHLNSDMGVVELVEEYYHCLSSCNDKRNAKRALVMLTNFESLSDLLANYNYPADDADTVTFELMDFD
nr:hypothetical protein [Samia ricini nucleopolyhedrovirus]